MAELRSKAEVARAQSHVAHLIDVSKYYNPTGIATAGFGVSFVPTTWLVVNTGKTKMKNIKSTPSIKTKPRLNVFH
jgi:hypothetical protein